MTACETRVLICVPSVAALENLHQLFDPRACRCETSLLDTALLLPDELLAPLRGRVRVLSSDCEPRLADDWVRPRTDRPAANPTLAQIVLSTWQQLGPIARKFAAHKFSNVIVDEGDYGTVRTCRSTASSWCNVLDHFSSARQLLLSGTRQRPDRLPLPEPFYVYSYNDALRDGVVKRVQFILLQPSGIKTHALSFALSIRCPCSCLQRSTFIEKRTGGPHPSRTAA